MKLAESSKLFCIDKLPSLQELIYVTHAPHRFCILLRYRDIWFEDIKFGVGSRKLISKSTVAKQPKERREDELRRVWGGVADRARRKERWAASSGASVGIENYADTFRMRMVGGKGRIKSVQGEEERFMPPWNCDYCKAHK